ncbi:MAG TPA: VWA domain-containing protein [Acidobacteriaceae bacterium]|nr:VWA domain-containing protein [Acidobacteriaceae bacterium]
MTAPARSCLSFLFPLLCIAAAAGQHAASPTPEGRPQANPPSRTIQLNVVVSNQSGAHAAGLQQKDFTVLDNNVPQTITSFRALTGSPEPVEVLLLLDAVNTPYEAVARERVGVDKFLRANNGRLAYPTQLVISTDKGVQLERGFSLDGNALAPVADHAMTGLRMDPLSTGVYGAMQRFQTSINAFHQVTTYAATLPGRKLILWISPGWPLFSGPDVQINGAEQKSFFELIVSISTQLRQADITVYNVNPWGAAEPMEQTFRYEEFLNGVTSPKGIRAANLGLQVIATHNGGLVLSSRDISGLLARCVADAGAYYKLSFESPPTERENVYHPLNVTIAEPGLTARTSTGYYAQP